MTDMEHARARAFDAWAGEYDRFRPGYPDELFDDIRDRLALSERPQVVDLGAGTGRASLAMAELGWRVTAVEPGRGMLDVLRSNATDRGLLVSIRPGRGGGDRPRSGDRRAGHRRPVVPLVRPGARAGRGGAHHCGPAGAWRSSGTCATPSARHSWPITASCSIATSARRTTWAATSGRAAISCARASRPAAAFEPLELVNLHHEVAMTPEQFIGTGLHRLVRARGALAGAAGPLPARPGGAPRHGTAHTDATPFPVPYRIDLWVARRRGS